MHIRIHEHEHRSGRGIGSTVTRRAASLVHACKHRHAAETTRDLACIVRAAIIYHDDLGGAVRLIEKRSEATRQVTRLIKRGNHYRHTRQAIQSLHAAQYTR